MEHLYIKEGTLPNVDFSEQYLQWSAKFEVRSFPNTSGSNASYNPQAVSNFGIVEEAVWPFQVAQWGTGEDEACTGEEDQPTLCYTNGHPTDEIKNSPRFFLPRGRFLNMRDLKAHLMKIETAAVVGFTFFYQAWNHRRSELPTTSANWNNGIVLYPNSKDRETSLAKRAGHSILIVGWDDEMELARRDEEGNVVTDSNGDPVMEKGFYLFKNSWGTVGFGIDHENGAGYGWISQRYLDEYGRSRISGVPTVERPDEVCDEGLDNDNNGDTETGSGGAILDNDSAGVSSPIRVVADVASGLAGAIDELNVTVDISHTWIGDLNVSLVRGDETIVLHNQAGGSTDDLATTFEVDDFDGSDFAGTWTLTVSDNAGSDVGMLNEWALKATLH